MGRSQAALRRLLSHMPVDHSHTTPMPMHMTDAALCEALAALASTARMTRSAVYTAHSLIRDALRGQCPDGRTRWPIFWTKGRCCRWVTSREVCLANTLPWGMVRCSDAPALRAVFERAADRILTQYGGIRRPSTGRKAFAFLWGFLVHPAVALAVPLEAGTSIRAALGECPVSWIVTGPRFVPGPKPGPRLHAYTQYRAACRRPVQLVALTRHVRWLSLFFHTGVRVLDRALTPGDFGLPSRTGNGNARRPAWKRLPVVDDAAESVSSGRFSLDTLTTTTPAALTPTVREWMRPLASRGDRPQHYFVAAEIRALYLACDTLFERILLTSLFTTGMRIGGFCTLEQPVAGEIRGVEKGNVSTTYCVTDVLCMLLNQWMEQRTGPSRYLFAGRDGGPDAHVAPSTVRRAFHRVAQRAGVTGPHVHPHTTRHTVAWTLHALGNSVERVAGFVGHRSPQVTSQVYIALTQAQQRALVDCPWLDATKTGDARRRMRREAEEMARAICSPFGSADGRTFPVQAPSELAHDHPRKGTVKALGRMARAYLQRDAQSM